MPKARLRTKTGCFTCKKRRLKCGEEKLGQPPCCRNCSIARRECLWPSQSDLYDRRHGCRCRRRSVILEPSSDAASLVPPPTPPPPPSSSCDNSNDQPLPAILLSSVTPNPALPTTIRSDKELSLFNYYLDRFLQVLLLPNAHPGFYSTYRSHMGRLMLHCNGVKCAILACAASNRFMLLSEGEGSGEKQRDRDRDRDREGKHRHTSLKYYAQAVREVNQALATLDLERDCPGDELLSTVQYLYLNAIWGPDTINDAPKHVNGAMQLLALRYKNAPSSSSDPAPMLSVFDRIVVESVVYQSFLLAMRNPFSPTFHIDSSFLRQTEKILEPLTFCETSAAANSPVLGIPVALYRLLLSVIQLGNYSSITKSIGGGGGGGGGGGMSSNCAAAATDLKTQMTTWEELVLDVEDSESNWIPAATATRITETREQQPYTHPHWDAVALYILAGSLLLDWIISASTPGPSPSSPHFTFNPTYAFPLSPPVPLHHQRWQLSRALSILRRPSRKEGWTRCYLGSWPTMVLGYAVHCRDDIALIRQVLCSMRQRLGYGEVERILAELEEAWAPRRRRWDDSRMGIGT